MGGYDFRPDLKAPYTAIVRARDEGELSLAAAQLNGGLRQKFTHHDRSGHGHSGVHALYARFAPDAASHLADLGAVAISANYLTLLRHDYAIDPIACIGRVRKAAPLLLPVVGCSVARFVKWPHVASGPESSRSPWWFGGVSLFVFGTKRVHAQRQRRGV